MRNYIQEHPEQLEPLDVDDEVDDFDGLSDRTEGLERRARGIKRVDDVDDLHAVERRRLGQHLAQRRGRARVDHCLRLVPLLLLLLVFRSLLLMH